MQCAHWSCFAVLTLACALVSDWTRVSAAQEDAPLRSVGMCGVEVNYSEAEMASSAAAFAALHAAHRAFKERERDVGTIADGDLSPLLGFSYRRSISGFCRRADGISDVRCFNPRTRELRHVCWINNRDGAALLWGDGLRGPVIVPAPPGDERVTLQLKPMSIGGAAVASPSRAVASVRAAYPDTSKRLSAVHRDGASTWCTSVKTVLHDMRGFAKRGDRVWEANHSLRPGLCTLLWVHSETGKLHYISEPWRRDGKDQLKVPETLDEIRAAVRDVVNASPSNAKVVARFAGAMMGNEINEIELATEGVGARYITRLGFDIPGFAGRGDRIWECHLSDGFRGVRLVIWVNPRSGKTLYLDRMFEQAVARDREEAGTR